jgi:hypothetical protein
MLYNSVFVAGDSQQLKRQQESLCSRALLGVCPTSYWCLDTAELDGRKRRMHASRSPVPEFLSPSAPNFLTISFSLLILFLFY